MTVIRNRGRTSSILGHSSTQITEQAYAELTTTKVADDFIRATG